MPRRNHSKSIPQGRKQFKLSTAMIREFRSLEAESIAVESMQSIDGESAFLRLLEKRQSDWDLDFELAGI